MAVFTACHQTSPKVLLKWWLSLKIVIMMVVLKDCHQTSPFAACHQTSPKVLLKWWLSPFTACHQTSPKVLLKWWLSLKIVSKHRPKFYWGDGCLYSLSSNIAQSSTEVMAVFKDCHQTSPKVLLKWWLSLHIVIKHCPQFWREKTANLQRLEKRTREKTAEKAC